ncbi:Transmembrane protein 70-like protein, mitochondrial [Armadillidium vulgare]|nr:Transmembrane protein 70-like protein, mitochondrial [Armadillidium vulgare]
MVLRNFFIMYKNCFICQYKFASKIFKSYNIFGNVQNPRCKTRLSLVTFSSVSNLSTASSANRNLITGKNIKSSVVNGSPNFSSSPYNFKDIQNYSSSSSETKEKEKKEQIIGEGTWEEIYKGVLTTQLKLLKMFSISTSAICLSVQPILYEKIGNTDLAIVVTLATFLGIFTFTTPALIHWVSKKYVTKLEYDPTRDIYAATTLSFFLREKKIHFKVDDVIRPEIPGLFTSFKVKKQALFVDPDTFKDIEHYSRIMGFDKPLDLSD